MVASKRSRIPLRSPIVNPPVSWLAHQVGRCRGIVHLNGEIDGFGDIKFRGDIEEDDNRLNVIGGSREFNGVAGKILLRNMNRRTTVLHFDLVR
jgi:hypothetical protein